MYLFMVDLEMLQVLNTEMCLDRLNLEIPSRTASEREIDGRIWFENLGIANTGPGAPPPVH